MNKSIIILTTKTAIQMDSDIKKIAKKYGNIKKKGDTIPVSGKIFDHREIENLILASVEGWWTEGKWTALFEDKLKKFLGIRYVHACNSGSSANLLAFATLCSNSLGEERIKRGDEVITLAAAFPTTVNPIIQYGCVPVFVDIELPTYNIDILELDKSLSKKTKAVMIAHTLGNPFNIKAVKSFCKKNKLWLIEDNCDALGSKFGGKFTGTFGDISSLSFYPAHHITTAEGGAVLTNNPRLSKIIVSIRDWGRHCWCSTGKDNTCNNRYKWKLGNLPEGYDHKYIYGELGYNLKISDLHAAIGVAQIDKLSAFIKKRVENFAYLSKKMEKLKEYFILPKATKDSEPSWFGFLVTIRDKKINREELLRHLAEERIGSRLLFSGNITLQPYFSNNRDIKYRKVGKLPNTNLVMKNTFWLGVFPGINNKMIDKMALSISDFNNTFKLRNIK